MLHICPRSCSNLATAAVFVSVGVVQIFAGLILLQSKYVYLLAGPDIWTAFSNLSAGAALGISSRIWKNLRKASAKHVLKRNLLGALMISTIIINATTITLLVLGENNALLAIYLETNGRYHSVTLASELLAYAYASSICSPVICLLAAVIHLSANCFQVRLENKAKTVPNKKRKINEDVPRSYNWVFGREEKLLEHDSTSILTVSFSESSTSSDDSFGEDNASIDIPLQKPAEMENFQSFDEVFQRKISYTDFIMIEKCSLPFKILHLNSNHPNMKAETTCTFATYSDERKHLVHALAVNDKPQKKQSDGTKERTENLVLEKCLEVEGTFKAELSSVSNESPDLDDSSLDDSSFDVSQTPFWAGEVIPVTINSPSAQFLNLTALASPPVSSNANDCGIFKEKLDSSTKNGSHFVSDCTEAKYERKSVSFSTFVGIKNKDSLMPNHLQVDLEVQPFDEKKKSTQLTLNEVNIDHTAVSSNKPPILEERNDFVTVNEKPLYAKEWPSMEVGAYVKGYTYSRKNHIRRLWANVISDVKRSSSDSILDDASLTDVLERELVTKLCHDTMFRKVLEKRLIEKKVSSNFEENSQICAGHKNFSNNAE